MRTKEIDKVDAAMELLRKELPPIFAREKVGQLLGGMFSAKTLRNLDAKGKGPEEGRLSLNGSKVCYQREPFLRWLRPQLKSMDVGC